jgi:hypothetical protein
MKKSLLLGLVMVVGATALFVGCEKEAEVEYDYVIGKIPYTFEHAYHQAVAR